MNLASIVSIISLANEILKHFFIGKSGGAKRYIKKRGDEGLYIVIHLGNISEIIDAVDGGIDDEARANLRDAHAELIAARENDNG